MERKSVIERIESLDELKSPPAILQELLSLFDDPDVEIDDLVKVIEKDVNITSKIIKMANSAFYAPPSPITTTKSAIMRIGLRGVEVIALGLGIFDKVNIIDHKGFDYIFRVHSLSVAVIASQLATIANCDISSEEAFVAGLLHDIGIMVFYIISGDDYIDIVSNTDMNFLDKEKEVFGMTHEEAGEILLEKWKFPKIFRKIIGKHHISDKNDKSSLLIKFADVTATRYFDSFFEFRWEDMREYMEIAGVLEVSMNKIESMERDLYNQVYTMAEVCDVEMEDTISLLQKANKKLFDLNFILLKTIEENRKLYKEAMEKEKERVQKEILQVTVVTLSHYINNILTSIMGESNILQKSDDDAVKYIGKHIEDNAIKIHSVMETINNITSIKVKPYVDSLKMLDIEEELKKNIEKLKNDE